MQHHMDSYCHQAKTEKKDLGIKLSLDFDRQLDNIEDIYAVVILKDRAVR